jgi:hypothetical protein
MNISRYTNNDKFVNIRYIFLLARQAELIISASPNVEITSPGLGDLLTPVIMTEDLYYSSQMATETEFAIFKGR